MTPKQTPAKQLLPEQKKIRIWRIVLLSLFLLTLLWLFIYIAIPAKVKDGNIKTAYYSSLNESSCEIQLECNRRVDGATAEICFYATENLTYPICTKTVEMFGIGDTLTAYVHDIPDNVKSFKIKSITIQKDNISRLLIFSCACLPALLFFISALLLSCNVYLYNDKKIVVYAGWYHHYILVNGEKYDEHNTIMFFTPILLSASLDDGSEVKATISLTNRIALKINGKLCEKESE